MSSPSISTGVAPLLQRLAFLQRLAVYHVIVAPSSSLSSPRLIVVVSIAKWCELSWQEVTIRFALRISTPRLFSLFRLISTSSRLHLVCFLLNLESRSSWTVMPPMFLSSQSTRYSMTLFCNVFNNAHQVSTVPQLRPAFAPAIQPRIIRDASQLVACSSSPSRSPCEPPLRCDSGLARFW